MGSLISILVPLLALLVTFAWGMFLGTKRSRARFVCVIICFLLSLIFAFAVKNVKTFELMELLKPYLEGSNHDAADFIMNESIHEVVSACGGALLSPLAFLLSFVVLSVVTWVICHVAFLIGLLFVRKEDDFDDDEYGLAYHTDHHDFDPYEEPVFEDHGKKKKSKRSLPQIAIMAAIQVLLTVFVVMTPVVAYLDCIPNVVTVVAEVGVLSKVSEDANEMTAEKINHVVDEANKAPLVVCYRAIGGNAMCHSLTTIDVAGVHTDLGHEMAAIAKFSTDIYLLYGQNIKEYHEKEIELLRGIDESMHESVFLPVVGGELIYSITDAWLDEDGTQEFMGMNKPLYEDATTEMVAEPFDLLLRGFHQDARDVSALVRDFDTAERIVEILVHDGVFESMKGDTTNNLIKILSGGTTVKSLLVELESNPSFTDLATSIKKIGMRAVVSSIKMEAADVELGEQYVKEYSGEAADAINQFNAEGLTREEKKEKLTETLKENYATKTGKDMELEDEVVGIYADVLLDEFGDKENVTSEDVETFFNAYAGIESGTGATPEGTTPEGTIPEGTTPENGEGEENNEQTTA